MVSRFLTLAVALMLAFSAVQMLSQPAQAQVGCCMERQTVGGYSKWVEIGRDFQDCQKRNEKDTDNDVFEKKGRIWWNLNC